MFLIRADVPPGAYSGPAFPLRTVRMRTKQSLRGFTGNSPQLPGAWRNMAPNESHVKKKTYKKHAMKIEGLQKNLSNKFTRITVI